LLPTRSGADPCAGRGANSRGPEREGFRRV